MCVCILNIFLKNKTITYRRCNIIKQRNNYNQEKCRREAFLLLDIYRLTKSNEIQMKYIHNFR